jgi:flagellar L-ring protein precursor FlgH
MRLLRSVAVLALVVVAGCTSNPTRVVEVHAPVSVRPSPPPVVTPAPSNGAIFQPQAVAHVRYVPLFEDPRARAVGDTLTVQINEKINAQKSAQSAADRKGGMTFVVPEIQLGTRSYPGGKIAADSKNTFEGSGDSAANNLFTGTIAVTVIDVLPNGNLLVAGEKQIGINQGSEFIRLSGVVNPRFILAGNIVSSTTIADARLEYRGTGYLDEAQTMGWLSRIFMTVMPF